MPTGLIVRDENGVVTLDTTTRLGRILGFAEVLVDVNGSVSPAGADTGDLFALFMNFTGSSFGQVSQVRQPNLIIGASTISWNWNGISGPKIPLTLAYGVY